MGRSVKKLDEWNKAYKMHQSGHLFGEIAARLNISYTTARSYVAKGKACRRYINRDIIKGIQECHGTVEEIAREFIKGCKSVEQTQAAKKARKLYIKRCQIANATKILTRIMDGLPNGTQRENIYSAVQLINSCYF